MSTLSCPPERLSRRGYPLLVFGAVRFGVLGPLRVERDGEPLALGGPRQRDLLTLLVLRANRVVSAGWLVDALWDGRPPAGAHITLRSYVAVLRRALEPERGRRAPAELLRGHTGGYELSAPPDTVDAVRFTALAGHGARALADGEWEAAERHFADALALWRGGLTTDLAAVRPDATRLAEARAEAGEGRFTAAVAAGRHQAVLPDLRQFVAAHPERENARAQLMLALYRAGRQTDALAVYDEGRRLLADEHGVEPGEALRDLHRRVLAHTVPPVGGKAGAATRTRGPGRTAGPGRAAGGPHATLVGRTAELSLLTDLLAASGRDGGRFAAIVGEAGIGKTTLADALARRAADAGVPVAWGRCPDLGQAPPFWLWTQVVRALAPAGDEEADPALAGFGTGPATGADIDPTARFRTYDAVSALVHATARARGLVLVLDDLHAADADSLLLLRYLATTVRTSRALVVATLRPYEHDPALVAALADLARSPGCRQLRPAGLDADAVADLVREHTGAPAPADLVRDLLTRTGGNPFFITELLTSAEPTGAPPPSVRDTVRRRLHALDDRTRDWLDVLSVAGRDLDVDLLEAATTTEVRLTPHVAHLVAEPGAGVVRFRHPLFAEAAYADLAPTRRADLHARLADAGRHVLTPAELAHHYDRARGREDEHLRWTLEAADDATRRLAYEDALAHLDRAAALLTAPERELAVQLHRTSLLQITVGIGSDAVDLAAARARELLARVDPGADVRHALWTLGELACNRAEFAIAADLAGRLASDDGVIGAAGHYLLGVVGYFTGRLVEADRHLTAAIDRLRELDPRELVGRAGRTPTLATYDFRALVRSLLGDAAAARSDLAAAHALAERADDPYGRANATLFAAWTAVQEHDVAAALAAARRCREIGRRQHMPHFVTTGDFYAEWAAVRGGDDSRLTAMRAAREGVHRLGLRATRTISLGAMADAYLVTGHHADAAALADEGLAIAEQVGERVFAAELHRVRGLATGDPADLAAGARLAEAQGADLVRARFPR
ncbi:BTAD domain-containing putative transcriptional regulator [Saccharothrix texasensis]|uniref:SARP family transcriptional regulator n=1 Tax=Saccharothrix texasensis TaxID=103734 RepID=A0A3N1HJQ3_9PSEU|nr:BTAD domain-containing putative transcriptional regulator [Saccharothrix texasensis]ROP42681.1 SARP family transcriptional regulator [Saccharothrix texasensis]